jgi:hypothetical protein
MAVNTKDKYYTPEWLVNHTIRKAIEIIGKENITEVVEPSAGDGAFLEALKSNFNNIPLKFYDLYPEHPEVMKMDYKKVLLSYKKGRLTIGNPPFGTSSSLWKAFSKKAATNSDFIAFISPASQYNSNYYFKEGVLIYSELLNDVEYRGSETEGGKAQKVRTCLNIYKVYDREEQEDWREDLIKKQLRFGRRYKDGSGSENFYDYYLASMTSGPRFRTLCEEPEYYVTFGVSVLDENIRSKVEYILKNEFYKHIHKIREENSCGLFFINNTNFIDIMKKHLYPTREERLEQDVKIHTIHKYKSGDFLEQYKENDGIVEQDWRDYEYFISGWGFSISEITKEPKYSISWGIKILNENKRKEIENILFNLKCKIKGSINPGADYLRMNELKEILIKYLYPTREERLEQDVIMKEVRTPSKKTGISRNIDFDADFYIGNWGAGPIGKITKIPKYQNSLGIKIINEKLRKEIEQFFYTYKEKYIDSGLQNERNIGGAWLNRIFLKQKLIDLLYPEDEFSDYPEVRKPVHIQRAIYAKPLIPIEYEPERVKPKKEEKKVKIIQLF